MKCYVHPDTDPVGTCISCGRGICKACAVDVRGKLVCRECLAAGTGPTGERPVKDRSIALILEILPGLFGFLGLGWIYADNVNTGLTYLLVNLVIVIAFVVIDALTGGFACCVTLPIQIGIIFFSVSNLRKYIETRSDLFGVV